METTKNIFDTNSNAFKQLYKERNSTSQMFCLKTVSDEFVFKELNSLNITNSTGVDNIPARFLNNGASFF